MPPVEAPWRNDGPFLNGTGISAITATGSRGGSTFDEVRTEGGTVVGHMRTLRLLTDAEAGFAATNGWDALVDTAGSVDALLDVTRESTVASGGASGLPVFLSKLHAQYPPRWVTFVGDSIESVTGLESEEYMDDAANHEIWDVCSFTDRFRWGADFLAVARPGDTALFTDTSGAYELEVD